ncbi:hypothetical protein [Acidovorax sp. Leaf73]|uniref:hypothetical protein n=1 Tax=Acidovorax sp. Leaf73 TaxID=2876566 RepID=UPI001E652FED|nr:hypothetical protein [Acidovorax sp. Leaf73]
MSKATFATGDTTPAKAPMSNAERQRKHREKRKAELQALRAGAAAPLLLRLAQPLPSALPVAASALPDDSPSLRMQLDAARKRCEVQAAELAALRAEHEPLVARLLALRTVLRAVIGKFSPAARHVARSHLQETGFIEWLDAD